MDTDIETATISARGQVCIPSAMRSRLGLKDGTKIVFIRSGDSLMLKPATLKTFEEITKPLKVEAKRLGLRESEAGAMVERFRSGR